MLDEQIKNGERSFKDVSEEMWGSLNVPFDDGFEVMQRTLEIDPDFQGFHKFCLSHDIPFNVISAGLKPVLRRVLDTFLGEEEVSLRPNLPSSHVLPLVVRGGECMRLTLSPPTVFPYRHRGQRRRDQGGWVRMEAHLETRHATRPR